jgi:atypical dual specificity phosphatase
MPTDTPPRPNGNTYWVVPLKFLAGEYPGDKDPVKARKKIKQFLEGGVRHFIDLTELEDKLVPYDAVLSEEARDSSIDVTYQRFPIHDNSVPRNSEHLAEIGDRSSHQGRRRGLPALLGRSRSHRAGGCVLVARARANTGRCFGRVEREMEYR